MIGSLMQLHDIDGVVVGADRIVANGDTANKIGTYQAAVLAQRHGVPFMVAAPVTTVDLSLHTGKELVFISSHCFLLVTYAVAEEAESTSNSDPRSRPHSYVGGISILET